MLRHRQAARLAVRRATAPSLDFRLLSRICGSMEALEVGLAYDTARFPWLDRCGTHKIFLLPLGFCCSGLRPRRRRSHLSHETSSSVALHGRVACGLLSSSALIDPA